MASLLNATAPARSVLASEGRASPRVVSQRANSRAACRAVAGSENLIGAHAMVFSGEWTPEDAKRAISGAKRHNFDLVEMNLSEPHTIDVNMTKDLLAEYDLQAAGSLGLSLANDISSTDESVSSKGKELLATALQLAHTLGIKYLVGVNYCALHKYPRPITPEEYKACVKNLKEVTARAGDLGITWGLEIVNRYETNIINTAQQGMELLTAVNMPNVKLHLDSYHCNIEENSMAEAVAACGDQLGYVHLGESHRGYLGRGSVDWDGLFNALAKSGYKGPMTFETFSSAVVNEALSNNLCVWRNLWSDPDDLAKCAHEFVTTKWSEALSRV